MVLYAIMDIIKHATRKAALLQVGADSYGKDRMGAERVGCSLNGSVSEE